MFRTTALVLLCSIAMSPTVAGKTRCEKLACEEVKADIREVQARMRAGYTAAEGVRLDAKLRRLRSKRAKLCR